MWSEIPVEQYIEVEYAKATATGLPVIASIGYTTEDVLDLGPRIEATGMVDAIEFVLHYTGQGYDPVIAAAKALRNAVRLPIFAKLSPGMPEIAAVARAIEASVDGFIAVNAIGTSLMFDRIHGTAHLGSKFGTGWLSGGPLKPIALRCVFEIAREVSKPVIGVGGIATGADAIDFFMAGASAVQICTAAILHGPAVYGRVATEIAQWLERHGYSSINQIRGKYLDTYHKGQKIEFAGRPPHIDQSKCVRCGLCVTSCCPEALSLCGSDDEKTLVVDNHTCVHCGLCLSICPKAALS